MHYNFHDIFSVETNTDCFEDLLHAFRCEREAMFRLSFLEDNQLRIEPDGKPGINTMFFWNESAKSVEFHYKWIRPISARLTVSDTSATFSFNSAYRRFSNLVAEGWELVDIFRSLVQMFLIQNRMYMIHGAAVKLNGTGLLFPSIGNTGKTTISWMLSKNGAEFLTDEFAILDDQTHCFGFPCSSIISSNLVKKIDLSLSARQKFVVRLNDLRTKLLSTRFAQGGIRLYPDKFFKVADSVNIEHIVFVQKGPNGLHPISLSDAQTKLRAIQAYEMNWGANPYVIARSFFDPAFGLEHISGLERAAIRSLFSRVNSFHLMSSRDPSHSFLAEGLGSRLIRTVDSAT